MTSLVGIQYDCIVIGAGIEGSATAYHLSKKKKKTLLLEQFGLPHSRGSSHGQSRITRFSYSQEHYMKMMEEAFPLWSQLEKETETTLFKNTKLLVIQKPPYDLLDNRKRELLKCGKPFKELTHEELRQNYPGMKLSKDFRAVLDHSAGTLRADKALRGFQVQFEKQGGILKDEEKVLNIIPGRYVLVYTNKAVYRANSVVITPGAWASKLLKPLGLNIPLQVWRINVCYWREKFGDFDKMPCVIDDSTGEKHVYLLPMHEYPGLVKIAYHSGIDCDPDRRDEHAPTDDREVKIIQRFINNYLPGIDGNKPVITESCMYTVTPDWELVLDHHPSHPNIVIGCGFSGHGFKLAPVVGKILSELATGQEPSYDISALRISRFGKSVVSKASL